MLLVRELIEELGKFDPETPVMIIVHSRRGRGHCHIDTVVAGNETPLGGPELPVVLIKS